MTAGPEAKIRGIVPPLVTPLTASGGLDVGGLGRLVERLIGGGVAGLFILGTTGEGPSLGGALQREVIRETLRITAGRVPVLVGVSHTALAEIESLTGYAGEQGATAAVATPPYYFPITQDDLRKWFERLADRTPLPVFLYNMPSCVKTPIAFETLEALADHRRFCGFKDSSGDLSYFRRSLSLKQKRPDWSFLVGPEHLLGEATLSGGDGGINGGAMIRPETYVEMFEAADERRLVDIEPLQQQILEVGRLFEFATDFAAVARGIKGALSRLGVCEPHMAPPLSAYGEEVLRRMDPLLERMGLRAAG